VHEFYKEALKSPRVSDKLIARINKEIQLLKNGLPCSITNSIFVKQDTSRQDIFKVLILGSKDTPYAYGAFVFDVWFQPSYPSDPPHIKIKTGRN
jgi:baculoviral IAP repeat-containing protein 6